MVGSLGSNLCYILTNTFSKAGLLSCWLDCLLSIPVSVCIIKWEDLLLQVRIGIGAPSLQGYSVRTKMTVVFSLGLR